jgi:RimJ/RimL family protein N-acetyltransferase
VSQPLLTTERFELWLPQALDREDLYLLTEHEETRRYLGGMASDRADSFGRLLKNAGCWSLYGYGTLMVREKGGQSILANCGVFHTWRGLPGMDDVPEAGWIVRHDWWGKGVAGEVMRAALAWFDASHGPRRVTCMIEAGNVASERVAAGLGFAEYHRVVEGEDLPLVLYERP